MQKELHKTLLAFLFVTAAFSISYAQEAVTDSVSVMQEEPKKKNFINKVLDYFKDSNKEKPRKKFDFSFLGGPHYSSDTGVGLGLLAAGYYRTNLADTVTTPSMVSLYGDVSSVGFYLIGIRGYHIFPSDKYRLNYKLYFYSFPSKYWGCGYAEGANDKNESSYKKKEATIMVDFQTKIGKHFYFGPSLEYSFVQANQVESPWLWHGEDDVIHTSGIGAKAYFDNRDNIANAYQGVYICAEQKFYPRAFGNDNYNFSSTEVWMNAYNKVWKGGVIATQIHGRFTYGHTPWSQLTILGGSYSMRGYYEGRYRDKCGVDATVELRQHVWRRNGIVVWVGAGNIFRTFESFTWRHTLPNYGLGYRWEFKNRVNVRLDLGFGKGQTGFIFNINEAF